MSRHIAQDVFKYPLVNLIRNGTDECLIPAGQIVHVAAQNPGDPLPTVWVQHGVEWDDADERPRVLTSDQLRISIVGTGHTFVPDGRHVGSAVCANGRLVWHLYANEVAGTEEVSGSAS